MRKISILVLIFSVALVGVVYALSVGQTVPGVQVRDSQNRPTAIPDLGSKVVTVFYNDTSAADFTDPIATALKDKDYPKAKYRGQGIANMLDSGGVPDWLIRSIVRKKEKKFDTKILTDPSHLLKNAWNLGDCNDIGVVIVIGKDRVVRHMSKIKSVAQGRALVNTIVGIVDAEIAKIK